MDPTPSDDITSSIQRRWIWLPDWQDHSINESSRMASFQRTLSLPSVPTTSLIRLTADTRYKLLINGKRICVGPSRGSDRIWYYDTIDLTPHLVVGSNIITIHVLRYFPSANAGFSFGRTSSPGLSVFGWVGDEDISTNVDGWQGRFESHIHLPLNPEHDIFLQHFERISPSPPTPWITPIQLNMPVHLYGIQTPWNLSSRMIPMAEETLISLHRIRDLQSTENESSWLCLIQGDSSISLPPKTTHRVELETPTHSTAFLRFIFARPTTPGATIKITYSEAYQKGSKDGNGIATKGDRLQREGNILEGPWDSYTLTGGEGGDESYEPFWWRTFRFVVLEIVTGEDGLVFKEIQLAQTNYPVNVTADWETENDEMRSLWDVSLRTLRNCMFDGYSDCPFYEQLQYCEDTRSQILFHYHISGDDRLARQAITAFAASLQPNGLVHARYPAHGTQIITGFSLFWVLMVCDHMQYHNDVVFATQFLPAIDAVLGFFEARVGENGLVGGIPRQQWAFVDWNSGWGRDEHCSDPGVPIGGRANTEFTYFTMLYAYTLQQVCILLRSAGRTALIDDYQQRNAAAIQAVKTHCWDGQFFTDSIAHSSTPRHYSQHCQIMAVLCGAVDSTEGLRILSAAFSPSHPTTFATCSYVMLFYAFRAFALLPPSFYNSRFSTMWDPWRKMLAKNLTTWEEDDVSARSDCHAWGALPLYEFTSEVAGLKPGRPGWGRVDWKPRLGLFERLRVKVPLSGLGVATVGWKKEEGVTRATLTLPMEMEVWSTLPDGKTEKHGVVKEVHLSY